VPVTTRVPEAVSLAPGAAENAAAEERCSRLREEADGTGSTRPTEGVRASTKRKLGRCFALYRGLREGPAEAGGAPSSAPLSSVEKAEGVERFVAGARGVGRLMHTSGRRILSAEISRCREAPHDQAVQRRGELPPEYAGEKGPIREKGAKAAQGN